LAFIVLPREATADGDILSMEYLLHGARRELQKMGRLVNEKDLVM
jgi:hypothetical protein